VISAHFLKEIIDLTTREDLRTRKPILIAHRGGVITDISPECSLAAMRLAAQCGYDMVELDVQETADHQAVVFHDRDLGRGTAAKGRISDYTLAKVTTIRFQGHEETIPALETALALCRNLGLGVMIDVKVDGSEGFLRNVRALIDDTGLANSAMAISGQPMVRKFLGERMMLRILPDEMQGWKSDNSVPVQKRFWFGVAQDLPMHLMPEMQRRGVLVIPAINTFRYPRENHRELAGADIERLLKAGVDGIQLDSVYQDFVGLGAPNTARGRNRRRSSQNDQP
jgi:glycerophosphoryl diester phosphodiesterase